MCGKHAGIRVDRVPGKWPAQNGADANLNIHPSTLVMFFSCVRLFSFSSCHLSFERAEGTLGSCQSHFFLLLEGGREEE
jgi:hypothetical protein